MLDHMRLHSDHVGDIRRASRITKYRVLQIVRDEAMPDREREEIDHLVHIRPDKMRAKDTAAVLFDDRLGAIDVCGDAPRALSPTEGRCL